MYAILYYVYILFCHGGMHASMQPTEGATKPPNLVKYSLPYELIMCMHHFIWLCFVCVCLVECSVFTVWLNCETCLLDLGRITGLVCWLVATLLHGGVQTFRQLDCCRHWSWRYCFIEAFLDHLWNMDS